MAKADGENGETASGVKSVSQAIRILNIVAEMGGPGSLKEIAARAGVAPSKAHRYLQSLCNCGFLSQTVKSGAYDLGMETLRLGLAAINRVDIINRAGEALGALTAETGADSFLTVWADAGPTIVRFERSKRPAVAMLGAGSALPVLTTATGLVFLAFGPPDRIREAVHQHADNDNEEAMMREVSAKVAVVKQAGFACTSGAIVPGRQCASAPMISYDDKLIAAVTLVTASSRTDEPDPAHVEMMLDFARRFSVRKRGCAEESQIEKRIAI